MSSGVIEDAIANVVAERNDLKERGQELPACWVVEVNLAFGINYTVSINEVVFEKSEKMDLPESDVIEGLVHYVVGEIETNLNWQEIDGFETTGVMQ